MKETGIQWIGAIPDSWRLNKIGQLFNLRNEKVSDKVYAPLSVSRGGVVPQMESVAKSDASDDRKLVLVGDFAINSRSDRKQSCGVSPLDGSVSLINLILYAKDDNTIYNDYMNYLLKNYGFAEEFYRWGHGIVADLWTTRWQEMKSIMLPLPFVEVQKKLFEYLTEKSAEIDALIEVENKQIEKLKEYKQAVITEAVTKGLDKSAPMKDSSVDWIGEIPQGWSLNRLKFVASYNDDSLKEDIPSDTEIEYVDIGSVSLEDGITKTERFLFNDAPSRARRITRLGDIIVSTVRTYLKAIASIDKDDLIVSTGFCVIRPKETMDRRFVEFWCKSNKFTDEVSRNSYGISYPAINATALMDFWITMPSLVEQKQIAEYLSIKCSDIDCLLKIKQQKIDELNEYKKSFIYEYVTGKKEVV